MALKLSTVLCKATPSWALKSVSRALAKTANKFPSLAVKDALAVVTRKSREMPYCSMSNSGFWTSISERSIKLSSLPSGETRTEWVSSTVLLLPGLSFSRRKLIKAATAAGSPMSGKVAKLPVASMPFSSNKTRVGKL
eukprot:CAMPEP_0172472410 /NCGR_PEP_ID=MMETSP1065-20121228/68323_1 /TAXON_ID=265537 /ORGANISM="Amphiprora paludosa, Strain CCMP125" /LENGTH=137 /DNA_ID=CAMNT_0013230545 /DNA_START=207 /DNA_END=620 /DNA_ORIENTATION=+